MSFAKHYTSIAPGMAILLPVTLMVLAGCSGAKKTEKSETTSSSNPLHAHEADFRPSDYDLDLSLVFSELRKEREGKDPPSENVPAIETRVLVPGYRVQLYATTNIDEANAQKAFAEAAFSNEYFYIEYDPPAYKVRGGNFLTRSDAEAFAQFLQASGYPDAWVVPDRVVKNFPPRRSPKNQD